MTRRKMSGAELLAELDPGSLGRAAPAPAPPPAPVATPPATTGKVGRRSKAGPAPVPLNLRISVEQSEALKDAAHAYGKARGPGPTVTPQDVVRMLIDHALADPGFPGTIIKGTKS